MDSWDVFFTTLKQNSPYTYGMTKGGIVRIGSWATLENMGNSVVVRIWNEDRILEATYVETYKVIEFLRQTFRKRKSPH